jgi:deoxyadenosine/deoxycytidine kinase
MSKIISIEGNIGSGKSTILKLLQEYLSNNENIIFLQEPVEEWDTIKDKNNITILKKFYENQNKYSFAFQMMAYISRLKLLQETISKHPDAIIITERCLDTDRYVFAQMLYDSGKLEDVEYQIYLKWFDHFIDKKNIFKTVYLKTDPNICLSRIIKRNRNGESNISIEYLINCNKYHEDMIINSNNKILTINSNIDTDKNKNLIMEWLIMINEFIIN